MIRCYECEWYRERVNSLSGWCHNPKFPKKERVDAIDFCDDGKKKEAEATTPDLDRIMEDVKSGKQKFTPYHPEKRGG